MHRQRDLLVTARSEALFTSSVPTGSELDRHQVTEAVRSAVRAHHGVQGCAAQMAAEYGDYPETAAPRMRWARSTVARAYGSETW